MPLTISDINQWNKGQSLYIISFWSEIWTEAWIHNLGTKQWLILSTWQLMTTVTHGWTSLAYHHAWPTPNWNSTDSCTGMRARTQTQTKTYHVLLNEIHGLSLWCHSGSPGWEWGWMGTEYEWWPWKSTDEPTTEAADTTTHTDSAPTTRRTSIRRHDTWLQTSLMTAVTAKLLSINEP